MDPPPARSPASRRRDSRRRQRQRQQAAAAAAAATAPGPGAAVLAVEPQSAAATAPVTPAGAAATPPAVTRSRNQRRKARRRRDLSARAAGAADEAPAASPVPVPDAFLTQEGSAPEAGAAVLAVELQSTAATALATPAGAAATPAAATTRGRNRRRYRRRRDLSARRAAAADEALAASPAPVPDAISTQDGPAPQASCNLEATAAHLSDNVDVLPTTSEKLMSSDRTRKRNFQAGNKVLKDSAADGAACPSLAYRENSIRETEASRSKLFKRSNVRFPIDTCTAQRTDMDYHKTKSANLPGNLEEVYQERTCPGHHSLQKSEEYRQNENVPSLNSSSLQEGKKRRKKKGGKRHNRPKKTTSQDSPAPIASDNSGELAKSNLDCTNLVRNGLQEQDLACSSNSHNVNYLSPSHFAVEYMEKLKLVFSPGKSLGFPKKKLLILDLNGLLADINEDYHNAHMADAKVRRKLVFRRPYCDDFLNFCALNFELGIWSSRKRENVASVVDIVMSEFKPRLLFCWDLSKCTFTGHKTLENKHKPLVLKELRKLWNMEEPDLPWEEGDYSPSNTLLVDDSPYKALRNPPYTAIFPRSYSYLNRNDNSLGPGGDLRVYLQNLAAADDVEHFVRNNPFGQPFITESDPHWNFYAQIAGRECAPRRREICLRSRTIRASR